jgi:glutaredoxin 3
MEQKRKIEVFTAGCPVCQGVVDMVKELACSHCESTFYNLNNNEGLEKARAYGVTAVPAVAVNGALLECCKRRPITREDLEAAGTGKPL